MILRDLVKNVDIVQNAADLEMDIKGINCDSATIRSGELFVAIAGYKTDGHNYIEEAVKRGAQCIICQNQPCIDVPYIKVDDSRKALAHISGAWFGYPSEKIKLISVTGTNGKTTVTYLIKHIIENCSGSKVGLIGTIGNLIGDREIAAKLTTPDSYELQSILDKMVFEGCRYAVMEVSSHALYLSRVYGISHEIGIFTNLTPEHMDFHETMEEYANAKAMLFQNSCSSIINTDDQYSKHMIESAAGSVMTYAVSNADADITARNVKLYPEACEFDACMGDVQSHVKVNIPGMFSVYNALAAIGAGIKLGFDFDSIAKALYSCPGVKGRAEVLTLGKEFTVLVDYAHTPDALENIIKTARTITSGRVLTLFGCGGDRDKSKRPVMGKIAMELSDFVFVTSDNPRTENPAAIIEDILTGVTSVPKARENENYRVIRNRREAICEALDSLAEGDFLIIAGKGHETYQIIGKEKVHFDDHEVVDEHLRLMRKGKSWT